jgi:very-short-patch-repair endonuclease
MNKQEIKKRRDQRNKKPFPSEIWLEKFFKKNNVTTFLKNFCLEKRYFGDFVFRSLKIIVEIDGRSNPEQKQFQDKRDEFLASKGWKVFRLKFFELKGIGNNPSESVLKVLEQIKLQMKEVKTARRERHFSVAVEKAKKPSEVKVYRQELLAAYLKKRPKKKGLALK